MILDICGGEASEVVIAGSEPEDERVAYIRPGRIKDLIGIDVSKEKIVEILNNLGFKTSEEDGKIKAVSPTWRGDIEGEHDLVEEVVRMIGLDSIPAESLPHGKFPKQVLSPAQRRVVTLKHELASRGMYETVTWSFTDSNLAKDFRKGREPVLLLIRLLQIWMRCVRRFCRICCWRLRIIRRADMATLLCLRSDRNFTDASRANRIRSRQAFAAA